MHDLISKKKQLYTFNLLTSKLSVSYISVYISGKSLPNKQTRKYYTVLLTNIEQNIFYQRQRKKYINEWANEYFIYNESKETYKWLALIIYDFL